MSDEDAGVDGYSTSIADAKVELAGRLPDLRQLPGAPAGSDDAVLAMSLPRTYTAMPNPYAADVVRVDDEQSNVKEPYIGDVAIGKGHAIYKGHSYPTKVPHEAIMRYILHYTEPGDLVLDGFCGTGMTGVAAQACRQPDATMQRTVEAELGPVRWGGRKAFLQDLGPSATFIAAGLNLPIDADAFEKRAKAILADFDRDWGWMYRTKGPRGEECHIDFTVWSEVFTCPHCGGEVIMYDAAFDRRSKKLADEFPCTSCTAPVTKAALGRRKTRLRTLAGDQIDRVEYRPVEIHYRHGKTRDTKAPDADDIAVLRRIATEKLPPFPTDSLPLEGMLYDRPHLEPKGFTRVHHLWGDRALAALAVLWNKCAAESDPTLRLALLFWLEQGLWGMSWMNRYKASDFSQVNRQQSGVYYIASLHAEASPRYNLVGSLPPRGKLASLAKMWRQSPATDGQVRISTGSSEAIPLEDNTVDYAFVDPPFGANIPYADLAFVVEAWHGVTTHIKSEAIVNPRRGRDLLEYADVMERCFREFYRVLKPARWMTVEFSNSSNAVWLAIQEALSSAGFVVADTRVLDKTVLSQFQVTAKNAVKRDLIISAYKPADDVSDRVRIQAGSEEGVWAFVREHLRHLPIADKKDQKLGAIRERQPGRLFDRMVAYHVARGLTVPMTAGEFAEKSTRRFLMRDSMLFLPEQAEKYERMRLTYKELAQQVLFVTNESSAIQWLRQRLKSSPATFGEIQPDFFRETQSGAAAWEVLPDLRRLLEDNFVQDERGRWLVPDPKKTEHLEQLRTRSLLREFADYVKSRGSLERFRSEAVRAGFKDAWEKRDFETIAKVGMRLPEDVFVEDPALLHYYRNAERLAAG